MRLHLHCLVVAIFVGASALAGAAGDDRRAGSVAPRDAAYDAGVKAVERQDWPKAIGLLQAALKNDRTNADAYNWLGYAYRNSGDMKRAFAAYEEALRLDPKHLGAHEYVGEAYVLEKNLPKARGHLAALEALCGRNCPEYRELKEAIDKAQPAG